MKIGYGIQMYSLRDAVKEDMDKALKTVADMGYQYIEFAGFAGHSAEEIRAMLDQYGLKCSGTHTGLPALTPETIEETIAYHKAIGCDSIIVPSMPMNTEEELESSIAGFNYAQPILAQHGISLAFHNHSREFQLTAYGKIAHEELQKRTKIDFEIDTFWAFNAGLDPVQLITDLKDRIHVIHLKDGFKQTGDVPAKGMSLGSGEAPVAAVRERALELGFLMVVESETQDPTGPEEVKRCIDHLKSLEA